MCELKADMMSLKFVTS